MWEYEDLSLDLCNLGCDNVAELVLPLSLVSSCNGSHANI